MSARPSKIASSAQTPGTTHADADKAAHDAELAARRDDMVAGCTECTMPLEGDRASTLATAALGGRTAAALGDGSSLRVLVVGAETGKLACELLARGASHVLVIDHSRRMLDRAAEACEPPGVGGNAPGARFLESDVAVLPPYQGPFDAVVFNDTLSVQVDPVDALRRAVLLTRPGARVVVSERDRSAAGTPDAAPKIDVPALVRDLPLEASAAARDGKASSCVSADEASIGAAAEEDPSGGELWVYEVPPLFKLRDAAVLAANVVTGFGRGSKQMGVPTANLDPEALAAELAGLHRGVYFGYARLPDDVAHADWCKCVVNVGERPTFADGDGVTVEVHALRDFGRDFYGERMEVVVLGYLRPEMRFPGLPALVARIMTDIGLARGALDADEMKARVDAGVGFSE